MKSKKDRTRSITGPMVKELTDRQKADFKVSMPVPLVGSKPLEQPALYEDAGNGYNGNFTFPQD